MKDKFLTYFDLCFEYYSDKRDAVQQAISESQVNGTDYSAEVDKAFNDFGINQKREKLRSLRDELAKSDPPLFWEFEKARHQAALEVLNSERKNLRNNE